MSSKINLDVVRNWASYERFQLNEMHMHQNYGQYWTNQASTRFLKEPLPLLDIRATALAQFNRIADSFSHVILKKYFSYEQKKQMLVVRTPLEKQLNNTALDNMAKIFAANYMNPLFDEVQKIQVILPRVQKHFQRFQNLLNGFDKNPQDVAIHLIQDIHDVRKNLNQNLISLATRSEALALKIQMLTQRGNQIGPAFAINPAAFLTGCPMMLPKKSGLVGIDIPQAVIIIEDIKQQKSVAQGVEPLYLLFLNATQSLRKMEKGMALCLGERFGIASGFGNIELNAEHSDLPTVLDRADEKEMEDVPQIVIDPYVQKVTSHLTCPLTQKVFEDPVTLETGYSFERKALIEYLKGNDVCPRTKVKLSSQAFIPNLAVKSLSQRFATNQDQANFFQQVPEFESCISLDPFKAPVIVSSGITYESDEADDLFANNQPCHLTRVMLNPAVKVPNLTLLELMKAAAK